MINPFPKRFLQNSEAGGSCHSGQAKRDPESSPAWSGIQRILDSGACPGPDPGFAGKTEQATFARASPKLAFFNLRFSFFNPI
jgi:hypothetical protein